MDKNVLLIKPIEPETKTASGIIIPLKQEMYQKGLVVKIGELDQEIEVGNIAIYANNIFTEIEYNGEKHRLVNEQHVLAVI